MNANASDVSPLPLQEAARTGRRGALLLAIAPVVREDLSVVMREQTTTTTTTTTTKTTKTTSQEKDKLLGTFKGKAERG